MRKFLLAAALLVPCVAWGQEVGAPATAAISQATPGTTNGVAITSGTAFSITAPTGTLTRPSNTTGYTGTSATPQLVASSTTAGSIVVPTFSIASANGAVLPRLRLNTNVTTGWGSVVLVISIWTAAPTYTNGDGGTYAVATGSAKLAATYSCTLAQMADGANCRMAPLVATAPFVKPDSGTALQWDIQIQSSATPISGQTFTLTADSWN